MPPYIKQLFNEVKIEMLKIALIYSFLDSIMVFFISYFVISFFNIKFLYLLLVPGGITLIFFIANLVARINRLRLKNMEDANPQVKEMLRTAHDNMESDNVMALALFSELKSKMKTVSSGNLLESKVILIRIISAVVIVILTVAVSAYNVNLKKIDIPLDKLRFLSGSSSNDYPMEGSLSELTFNKTEVIYGDPSIAKLGSDRIDINVDPTMSQIDFKNIGQAEEQELRTGSIPQEISVRADAFNNQQQLEEAEQAANYSQRIKDI